MIAIILPILTAVAGFYIGRRRTWLSFIRPSTETSVAWQQTK